MGTYCSMLQNSGACYTNLGTLRGVSAGHFQEVYVKQYLLCKLLVSWQENDLALIIPVKQVRM